MLLAVLVALLIIGLFVLGLALRQRSRDNQATPAAPSIQISPNGEEVTYQGRSGKHVLELLKTYTRVETRVADKKEIVVAINEHAADGTRAWHYYVNNNSQDQDPNKYQTTNADTIVWRLELSQ